MVHEFNMAPCGNTHLRDSKNIVKFISPAFEGLTQTERLYLQLAALAAALQSQVIEGRDGAIHLQNKRV